MQQNSAAPTLAFPLAQPPDPGGLVEIAPGVRWFRLPLPYRLDHVNIYLIRDEGGWTVLDTGLGTDVCRAAWEAILNGPLAGQRLTAMIVTHFHPDTSASRVGSPIVSDCRCRCPVLNIYIASHCNMPQAIWAPICTGRSIVATGFPRRSPKRCWAAGMSTCARRQACPRPIIASSTAIRCGLAR